jgi:hypothetical protein
MMQFLLDATYRNSSQLLATPLVAAHLLLTPLRAAHLNASGPGGHPSGLGAEANFLMLLFPIGLFAALVNPKWLPSAPNPTCSNGKVTSSGGKSWITTAVTATETSNPHLPSARYASS